MNIKGILICFNINFEQKKSLDVAKFWRTNNKKTNNINLYNYYYSIVSWFCKCKITRIIFRKLKY